MASTTYSPQEALNLIEGASYKTQYTEQGIANLQMSYPPNTSSWQYILNTNLGLPPTYYSTQRALWHTLQSELNLTGADTQYSEQELLNMAYANSIPIANVEGTVDGLGTWGLLFLMAAA